MGNARRGGRLVGVRASPELNTLLGSGSGKGRLVCTLLEHGDFLTFSLAFARPISHATFFRCPFNTLSLQSSVENFLSPTPSSLPTSTPIHFPISPPNVRMYKKHRDLAIRQYPHPPLPSFAWVMAAQANPPSPAYAYGYIRNAQAHSRPRARARAHNSNYLPARRSLPPGLHEYPPSRPHSTTRLPPSPTKAKTTPILAAEHSSDKFMVNL